MELQGQGTQVVGANLRYTDNPMTVGVTAPKGDPADVVAAIYDGLESGAHEVLADETSRQVRQALSGRSRRSTPASPSVVQAALLNAPTIDGVVGGAPGSGSMTVASRTYAVPR